MAREGWKLKFNCQFNSYRCSKLLARCLLLADPVLFRNSSTARMWSTFHFFMLLGVMPKVRGEEWAHVSEKGFDRHRNALITCNYCERCFCGSAFKIRNHLMTCVSAPIEVITEMRYYLIFDYISWKIWNKSTRNKSISYLITWREL